MPHLRGHRHCAAGEPGFPGARRVPDHRGGRRGPVELPDVVVDGGRVPGDGRAHQRALPGADGAGKGHCLPRAGGEKAHPVPQQGLRPGGRAGLHLFQRHLHGGERPRQGEGRKGHEAGGEVPDGGHLPRLPRHPSQRGSPGPPSCGASPWTRPAPCPLSQLVQWGKSRAWLPARGDAPHGGEHLPVLPDGGPAAAGAGAGVPQPGQGLLYPVYRGAPADAAGSGGAQPHHRGALRAGRALHRAAPLQHCGAH